MPRLDDVCAITMGQSPDSSTYNKECNGLPFFQGNADFGESHPSVRMWCSEPSKIARENDILISVRAPIGALNIANCECCIGRGLAALTVNNDICTREYLWYALSSKIDELNSKGTGSTFKAVNKSTLSETEIPLPPLDEQRHIAATLDKVTDLISKRRQQLDKLDELVKARFVEMFGNFIYEHDRWKTCEVGDIADTIDPHPSHRTPPISANGVPYIGIADCDYTTKQINFETARKVGYNVLQEHIKRYTLSNGDFIIGKIGTIGKPFMVPAKQSYTLSANTVLIKPTKEKIAPEFLFAVFQSEYMDRIIDAEKKSTSQPAFGIQKVRKIAIPLPPMELQKQFAIFSDQTDKVKVTISHSLEKLETLKKALMQECFG